VNEAVRVPSVSSSHGDRGRLAQVSNLLIRESPAERSDWLWALATGIGVAVLTFLRVPSAWNTIWAEDGSIFLSNARATGFSSIGNFYRGYLYPVPRFGAEIAAKLPISWAAAVMATFATLVVAVCGAVVQHTSGSHLKSRWTRVPLGLSVALLPALRIESLANLADLQLFLVFASFWTLTWLPRSKIGQVGGSLFVILIGITSLLNLFLVPLALLRLVPKRGRAIAVSALASVGLHGVLVLTLNHSRRNLDGIPGASPVTELLKIFDTQLIGGPYPDSRFAALSAVLTGCLIIFIAMRVVRSKGAARSHLLAVVTLIVGTAIVMWVGTTLESGFDPRYAVDPAFLILSTIAVIVDVELQAPRAWRRASVVLPAAAVLLSILWSFEPSLYRTHGPPWITSLAFAQEVCRSNSDISGIGGITTKPGSHIVSITILPVYSPKPWTVDVPCAAIT